MKTVSIDELRREAEREAPPPRVAHQEPQQFRPRAIRRYFEVQPFEAGRATGICAREESVGEARKLAAQRAIAAGCDVLELLPWESVPSDLKNAIVMKHVCYDECSGGERITDRQSLRLLYPGV